MAQIKDEEMSYTNPPTDDTEGGGYLAPAPVAGDVRSGGTNMAKNQPGGEQSQTGPVVEAPGSGTLVDVDEEGRPVELPNTGLEVPQVNAGFLSEYSGNFSTGPGFDTSINKAVATTRRVGANELVENRLTGLLDSDSKYIQAARRTGMAQANARGGLGGSVGTGAAVAAAIRAGLPIAQADAQAFRDVAAQNMNALNQFSLANLQAATQLKATGIQAQARVQASKIAAEASVVTSKIQSHTAIRLGNLDSRTRMAVENVRGAIQERLATLNYDFSMNLEALRGEYRLAEADMQYDIASAQLDLQERGQMLEGASSIFAAYTNRLSSIEGMEMDDNARQRVYETAFNQAYNEFYILDLIYGTDLASTFAESSPGG